MRTKIKELRAKLDGPEFEAMFAELNEPKFAAMLEDLRTMTVDPKTQKLLDAMVAEMLEE